ncbi:MAG: TetR/AcrR family transcriptional regulator [Acidobacteriota bacterium]
MRYPKEHREEKRREILRSAARLFRERGYDGTGIDMIMEACGLTRGGFYGYFESKERLFAEIMDGEHDFIVRLENRDGETLAELREQALEVIGGYLAPENREGVVRGCSIAALSLDVGRHEAAGESYGNAVRKLAEELGKGVARSQTPDGRALASIALCVGALLVSQAVTDDELADDMESAALQACRRLLEGIPLS